MLRIMKPALALMLALACISARADEAPASTADAGTRPAGKVVANGAVPDEATRAAIITRLKTIYGDAAVVDHLQVDSVVAPPQWSHYVGKLIDPDLKQIRAGKLQIKGNNVRFSGQVANEAQRQKIVSVAAGHLNPTYTVKNALKVKARPSRQKVLDDALANRTIQFQSGSAVLTPSGKQILDQMAAALKKIGKARVEIDGYTDNVGRRMSNVSLSIARASAVKAYLADKGIDGGNLGVMGYGPDHPIADNTTAAGRARNRRIEFHVQH